MPFKVIIIGGGLAGSLLANGLIKHDIEVAVYDRLPRHSPRDGYDIRVGSPALEGMRACLAPAKLREIALKFGRSGGRKSGAPVCYDKHFNTLLDLRVFPAYSKSAPIHRGTLRDAFADPVHQAGKMFYEKAFDRFEVVVDAATSEEKVKVFFADGSVDECDLLVGADGSHSKINRLLGLDSISAIKTHVSFVTKGSLPTERFLQLPKRTVEAPVMTFADEKVMFFAAYLPDRNVNTSNALAEVIDEDAQPLISHDEEKSTCMLALQEPSHTVPDEAFKSWSNQDKWDFMSESIKASNWASEYHQILDLVRGEEIYVFRSRVAKRPASNWRTTNPSASPRVWLMGDAIHAMLPSRGMGGNQSMRDAATILPLLVRLAERAKVNKRATTEEVALACAEYEEEMLPRAFEWVKKSGGDDLMPISSTTLKGKVVFTLAGFVLRLAWVWYMIKGWVKEEKYMDDAPELAD